jgi:hypothetical protein
MDRVGELYGFPVAHNTWSQPPFYPPQPNIAPQAQPVRVWTPYFCLIFHIFHLAHLRTSSAHQHVRMRRQPAAHLEHLNTDLSISNMISYSFIWKPRI